DATRQKVKKNVSSLRYIALPNWAHDALLESSSSKPQDHCSTEVLEGSGNPNPTASSNRPADPIEILIPPGFQDLEFPAKVYKVEKAMYGLHQTLRAWYGLWYPKESPFDLIAYSDSDYGGATQDRKSTTEVCQFLGRRLISWQCKKQTIVATSTTEAKYVAAASCCGQFWSTARIEIKEEGTQILAIVDGIHRTITESSLRQNLKLKDEEGISSLPDTKLFENLTLMGYNISPNQKFTFQKGQFCHQLKQYTRRARIAQSSTLPIIADEPESPLRDISQGEACPINFCFIADQDRATISKSSTLPYDSAPKNWRLKFEAQEIEITRLKARVKLLKDRAGGAVEGSGDDALIKGMKLDEGEAAAKRVSDDTEEMETVLTSMDTATVLASGFAEVPTGSGSIPTPAPPAAEVPTSSDVVPTANLVFATATVVTPYRRRKGKEVMSQQRKPWTKKQKKDYYMAVIKSKLGWKGSKEEAERIKKKGLSLEQESAKKQKTSEEVTKEAKSSNEVPEEKSSTLPYDSAPRVTSPDAVEGSMQQTINELMALCTSLQRQYSELVVKFEAQEIEITRLKARLKLLEDRQGVATEGSGVDASIKRRRLDEGEAAAERASDDTKEMATVLTSIDAATVLASGAAEVPTGSGSIPTAGPPAAEVPTGSDVVPTANPVFSTATVVTLYRRRKGKEVMSQQSKPWTKKQKRDYYMAVIRNNLGWKVKDFRGMTFEEVEAKFNSVWKQMEDFILMGLKEEAERIKRKGLSLEQESAKKQKTSEEVTEEAKSSDEVPKEKVKEMIQLVPIEEVYVEALQVKHPFIDWEGRFEPIMKISQGDSQQQTTY
nr:putative ribonuclease H-like domain-containing protein [Tanacetum cinerariifolium]